MLTFPQDQTIGIWVTGFWWRPVDIAARIVALAGPSEILVSQTVRDLAAGSGIHFAAHGSHELRGVEGEYTLFAVED